MCFVSANVRSRWEDGNLIFSDEAGNDLLILDAANNKITIPASSALEVVAGATVSGILEDASATKKGIVELATGPETIAVTDQARAVTPYGLGAALAKCFLISFTGHNAAGACTATSVAKGDVIFGVAGLTDVGEFKSSFESVVTVADQIQQSSASNLSAKNYLALVYRPS